jgi:hypothetical protein
VLNKYLPQEIGEAPLYLTNELELVDAVERAARWNIQVVPAPKREFPAYASDDNMQGNFLKWTAYYITHHADNRVGIFVQISMQTSESDQLADDLGGPYPRLLVSATSCQDGSGQGVAILTADQINASYSRGDRESDSL